MASVEKDFIVKKGLKVSQDAEISGNLNVTGAVSFVDGLSVLGGGNVKITDLEVLGTIRSKATVGENILTVDGQGGSGAFLRRMTDQGGLGLQCDSSLILHAGDNLQRFADREGIGAGFGGENIYATADGSFILETGLQNLATDSTVGSRLQFTGDGRLRVNTGETSTYHLDVKSDEVSSNAAVARFRKTRDEFTRISEHLGFATSNGTTSGVALGAQADAFTGYVESYGTGKRHLAFRTDQAERMRIHQDGNVGIGTTNPTEKLHVEGRVVISSLEGGTIVLKPDTGDGHVLRYGGTGSGNQNVLRVLGVGDRERLRIDNNGAIGIGTASPLSKLHVQGGVRADSNGYTITDIGSLKTADSDVNLNSNQGIRFTKGSTERMRITPDGNVGIGDTAPASKLSVQSSETRISTFNSTQGSAEILVSNAAGAGTLIIANNAAEGDVQSRVRPTQENRGVAIGTASADVLTVNSNDTVSIGTTAKIHKFEVRAPQDFSGAIAQFSTTLEGGSFKNAQFRVLDNQIALVSGASDDLVLGTNQTNENIRIKTNGNVGIGTTTPEEKLHIDGNLKTSGSIDTTTLSSRSLIFKQTDASDSASISTEVIQGTTTTNMVFRLRDNGDDRFKFRMSPFLGTDEPNTGVDVDLVDLGFKTIGEVGSKEAIADYRVSGDLGVTRRLGAGIEEPESTLDVRSGAEGIISTFYGSGAGHIQVEQKDDLTFGFNVFNSRNMTFSTNQSEGMRLDAGGKLLIGQTTGTGNERLQVNGDASVSGSLRFKGSHSTDSATIFSENIEANKTNFVFRLSDDSDDKFVFRAKPASINDEFDLMDIRHEIENSEVKCKLQVNGDANLTGTLSAQSKSFVIDHPTKEGMKLQYGSLEGPENGVYVRGRLTDSDTIVLPDYWVGLVHEDTITVELTKIGRGQDLYVESFDVEKVVVGNEKGGMIDCFYTVYGERKDIERFEVEHEA